MQTIKRARELRKIQTDGEKLLWHHLRNCQLAGYKFRRQHPIGPYITDFCCMEKFLVVEVDGSQHVEQKIYDHQRTRFLENEGYKVLRFWADEVLRETEGVLNTILNELNKRPHPSLREGRGHPSPLPRGEGD